MNILILNLHLKTHKQAVMLQNIEHYRHLCSKFKKNTTSLKVTERGNMH